MFSNLSSKLRGSGQLPVEAPTGDSNVPSTSSSSVESDGSPDIVHKAAAEMAADSAGHPSVTPSSSADDLDLLNQHTSGSNPLTHASPFPADQQQRSKDQESEDAPVSFQLPRPQSEPSSDPELVPGECQLCKGYEEQLQTLQKEHTSVVNRLSATVAELHSVKKTNEELAIKANAEKNLFEEKTKSFEDRISNLTNRIDSLLLNYQEYRRSTEAEFLKLSREREIAQYELRKIEEHYTTLLGKRRDAAAEMSAPIDLPAAKTDLELYCLQMREDLLSTNVSRQHLMERLDSEMIAHRRQLADERRERMQNETMLQKRLFDAQEQINYLKKVNETSNQSAAARAAAERAAEQAATEAKQYKMKSDQLTNDYAQKVTELNHLKAKLSTLQTELNTSEAVQKDFVVLSQHLQMELQKQREQTHELRWQDPDDVSNCSSCKQTFTELDVKDNCKHCGHVFCQKCITKRIPPEGNRTRPASVCDVCHTLLVKNAAPYFSRGSFSTASNSDIQSQTTAVAAPTPRLLDRITKTSSEAASSTVHPSPPPRLLVGPTSRPNQT